MGRAVVLAYLCAMVLLASACSPKARLRASESMFQENRMERIALFSDGGVVWCSPFSIPMCVIDVAESRTALERFQGTVERELRFRGYDVTVSDVARVTHFNLRNLHVANAAYAAPERYKVFENYRKDRNGKFELPGAQPAYISPMMQGNPALLNAVSHVMTQIEICANERVQLEAFRPDEGDVKTIREAVDADTICVGKFYGEMFTGGYNAIAGIVGAGPVPGASKVFLMCFDAGSGDVLWQAYRVQRLPPDMDSTPEILVGQSLQLFPGKGNPIAQDCSLRVREGPVWACTDTGFDLVGHRDVFDKGEQTASAEITPPVAEAGASQKRETEEAPRRRLSRLEYFPDGGIMRGQYLGGGAVHGTLRSSHPAIEDSSGDGYHVIWGMRFTKQWSMEFDLGGYDIKVSENPDPYYPADNAEYTWISVGAKYDFAPIRDKDAIVWLSLGETLHVIDWDSYWYSLTGIGLSPGIGVDIKLAEHGIMRLGYKRHFFRLEDPDSSKSYNSGSDQFMFDLLYHFSRL